MSAHSDETCLASKKLGKVWFCSGDLLTNVVYEPEQYHILREFFGYDWWWFGEEGNKTGVRCITMDTPWARDLWKFLTAKGFVRIA